jgi:nucleotide-binding universal stress UspA family protein
MADSKQEIRENQKVLMDALHRVDEFKEKQKLSEFVKEVCTAEEAKKYVVCVDGSKWADLALEWALGAMNADSDMLTLLRVVDPDDLGKYAGHKDNDTHVAEAEAKMIETCKGANVTKLACVTIASEEAGRGICAFVCEHAYDVLVLGYRGGFRDRVKKTLGMGSVSTYCTDNAPGSTHVVVVESKSSNHEHNGRRREDESGLSAPHVRVDTYKF